MSDKVCTTEATILSNMATVALPGRLAPPSPLTSVMLPSNLVLPSMPVVGTGPRHVSTASGGRVVNYVVYGSGYVGHCTDDRRFCCGGCGHCGEDR